MRQAGDQGAKAANLTKQEWTKLGEEIKRTAPEVGKAVQSLVTPLALVGAGLEGIRSAAETLKEHFERSFKAGAESAKAFADAADAAGKRSRGAAETAGGRAAEGLEASGTLIRDYQGKGLSGAVELSRQTNVDVRRVMAAQLEMEKAAPGKLTAAQQAEAIAAAALAERTGRGKFEDVAGRAGGFIREAGAGRGAQTPQELAASAMAWSATPDPASVAKARALFNAAQDEAEDARIRAGIQRGDTNFRAAAKRPDFVPGMAESILKEEAGRAAFDAAERAKEDASFQAVRDQYGHVIGGRPSYRAQPFRLGAAQAAEAQRMSDELARQVGGAGSAVSAAEASRARMGVMRLGEAVTSGAAGQAAAEARLRADIAVPGGAAEVQARQERRDAIKRAMDYRDELAATRTSEGEDPGSFVGALKDIAYRNAMKAAELKKADEEIGKLQAEDAAKTSGQFGAFNLQAVRRITQGEAGPANKTEEEILKALQSIDNKLGSIDTKTKASPPAPAAP
jgi:hypothetical protein